MSQHVFAWVAGFGWTLMPCGPFRFERVGSRPRTLAVEHHGPSGLRQATVTVSDDGRRADYQLGPSTGRLAEVLDLIEGAAYEYWDHGAAYNHWRVETSVLTVRWPEGFALDSVAQPPPTFDLVGPDGGRLWVQGPLPPERLPQLDRMEGPGQTTERVSRGGGGQLVELRYLHEGSPWRMFHCVVERYPPYACVVTAQTPERWRELVSAAVEEVAVSLTPCPSE